MNLLITLGIGVALIILVFFALNRLLRLPARQSAVIVAILTLGMYLPYALLHWEGGDVLSIHLAVYLITVFMLGLLGFHHEQKRPDNVRSFRWGPGMIIGFFAVIIAMDAVFVTVATSGLSSNIAQSILPKPRHADNVSSHFPGVISHDYQKKESLYNEYLKKVREQEERGWQVHYGWVGEATTSQPTPFQVQARDKQGEPIRAATVEVRFLRPSDKKQDFSLTLPEVEPGLYRADITPSMPGLWQVVILVQRGADTHEVRAATDISVAKS